MNKNQTNINCILAIEMENVYSIKDPIRIDFRAANLHTSQAKLLSDNIFEWNGQKILKTVGLFGSNAAGKSNIIRAIIFFCRTILDSHQYNVNKKVFDFQPFKFDGYSAKPTRFYINFVCNNIEYEYQYTLNTHEILSESLYYYPSSRRAKVFERKAGEKKYTFGSKLLLRPKEIADSLLYNNLYLSRASAMNRELAIQVYDFFLHDFMLDLFPAQNDYVRAAFINYKPLILKALAICDSDISNIELRLKDVLQPVQVMQPNGEPTITLLPTKEPVFKTYHKQNPKMQFDMETEESEGTKRLFQIVLRFIDIIRNGKSLMLDEFDRQLHVRLADFIIDLVHATRHSQMLFTSHNTNLIDMKRFRKDQILFVNKRADGSTEVYSLYDFKDFRENMDAEKGYLQGRFDAVPAVSTSTAVLKSFLGEVQHE